MTSQGVSVRRADAGDGPTLARLRRMWADEDGPVGDPSFDERFADWFGREAEHRITWVAERSGQAVGMINVTVFVRMPRPSGPDRRWGYIANVFVLAAHRNTGVSSALLDAAAAHACDHGFVRLVLNPSERSIPLYRRRFPGLAPAPARSGDMTPVSGGRWLAVDGRDVVDEVEDVLGVVLRLDRREPVVVVLAEARDDPLGAFVADEVEIHRTGRPGWTSARTSRVHRMARSSSAGSVHRPKGWTTQADRRHGIG
jgi:GNAT superfamily N-acetyltransferase